MATSARFALPASLSFITISILCGCSSSTNNNNADAAAASAKMDAAFVTPSDLPPSISYDSSPLADGPANTDGPSVIDGPSMIADAFVPNDVAGKDVGIETSTDLPAVTSYDSSSGPDKPAIIDVPSDNSVDIAFPVDGPQAMSDLASGSVDTVAGPDVATCGSLSQPCCAKDGGETCNSNLLCLGGASCSCAKTLFGRYLLREDGALLYETDPTSTAQTTVLDANTGLPLANVTDALEGSTHGCAVLGTDQSVWCWRTAANGNSSGQLANGTTDTSGPVFRATQVLAAANQPLTNVVAVADVRQGNLGTVACAVTADGKLYCWGTLTWITNNGTALSSPYAIPVTTDGVTPLTGVVQASLDGSAYACAIVQGASSKDVWCWGENGNGQLGTGDQTSRRYPTKVVGIANPVKVVASGSYGTTCVIDGTNVRCWGLNVKGAVGNGTTNSPVLAPTLVTLSGGTTALSGIVDIVGGTYPNPLDGDFDAMCALANNNTVQCWGFGFQTSPATYGVSNVVALGTLGTSDSNATVRLLTSDGVYHIGTTTRSPNCGLLQ